MAKLSEKVQEFAEIAKTLPDNLQVVCFELLLRSHLEAGNNRAASEQFKDSELPPSPVRTVASTAIPANQEDIKVTDLHVKARKFLEKYASSVDYLNNIFFKEDGEFKPLYDDLKTNKISENQIRVTLLLALRNALRDGEFETNVEAVRQECIQRKCHDSKNFNANYNNNKLLFDFEKFDKETAGVRLSEAGKQELAKVIKELQ